MTKSTSGDEMNDEHAKKETTPNDGKPFFFKGWGFQPPNTSFYPGCVDRLLDGRVYGEFPKVGA